MKNKKILGIVGIILVILIIGAVVFGQNNFKKAEKKTEKTTEEKTEEPYLKAVYLKDVQGNIIFVQTDTDMVFFGTIPQELYDENEKKNHASRDDPFACLWFAGCVCKKLAK